MERGVCYGRIGTTCQPFGTLTSWAIDVLNIVCGHLDAEGGVMFPSPAANRGGNRRPSDLGGRGVAPRVSASDLAIRAKGGPRENTTIAVIATDAKLNKAQANRLAVMAQDGFARAIYPVHTPLDGDVIFSAATGALELPDPHYGMAELGMVAGNVMARAVARGVYAATALPFPGALPSWQDRFGR